MLKYTIFIVYFLFICSCGDRDSGYFPQSIKSVEVVSIEKYKGYIYLNDTIVFTGAYYRKGTLNALDDNLKIGDIIINKGNSIDSLWIYSIRSRDTTGYYTYRKNENCWYN